MSEEILMQRLRQTMIALSATTALTGAMALLGAAPAGAVNVPRVTGRAAAARRQPCPAAST